MATNNSINLKATGVVRYDSATGLFAASTFNQYEILLGGVANALVGVAPSATAGLPFVSNGSSANGSFGVAVVEGGGTGLSSLSAYALMAGGATSTGNMQQVSGLGNAGEVLTSSGAGALPVWAAAPLSDLPWTIVAGTSQTLVNDNGYISANAGVIAYTLPAASTVGSIIRITGVASSGGWTLAQNSLQSIEMGSSVSTVGVGGSLASTSSNDTIELLCVAASTTWVVLSSMGNISIV